MRPGLFWKGEVGKGAHPELNSGDAGCVSAASWDNEEVNKVAMGTGKGCDDDDMAKGCVGAEGEGEMGGGMPGNISLGLSKDSDLVMIRWVVKDEGQWPARKLLEPLLVIRQMMVSFEC
ncbi:hypothetical protein JB92DRAFT_2824910 [Gautieria morchelliformis]|nr:hypothetical protein JB92DRAFT_2824910 [Gautieria morchelliformis]